MHKSLDLVQDAGNGHLNHLTAKQPIHLPHMRVSTSLHLSFFIWPQA